MSPDRSRWHSRWFRVTITKIISNDMLVNIRSINFTSENGIFEGTITVYVNDTKHLKSVKEKIKALKGITSVDRLA